MLKQILAGLFALVLLSETALAEEDDKDVTDFVEIRGGKMVRERREVEIYDYHTGTYYRVDVYREPDGKTVSEPRIPQPSRGTEQSAPLR